jgi:hypothetical protein
VATYYVWSGAGGSANGSSWANAFTTLTAAFATEVAGDTLYVAHDHAESTASSVTLTSSGTLASMTKVICVDRAGSVPPVSADRRATAQVTTTGNSALNLFGIVHYDGIIFNCGSGANSVILSVGNAGIRLDNCSLRANATSGNAGAITFGGAITGAVSVELNNTTVSFGNVGQSILSYVKLKWRNTASALLGTIPTILFGAIAGRGTSVECIGVDLSGAGSGKTIVDGTSTTQGGSFRFIDCKLNASVTKASTPTSNGNPDIDFIRTGATGINYAVFSIRASGTLTEETTIVRTGGASDGTTPIAWKVVTTANCTYSMSFECPPIAIWNDTTGSAKTATVEGIWGGGAVPNDDDIWLDIEYLGDASSPQGSFINDGKADLLTTAAAQSSSSEAWGGSTTKFKLAASFTPQQKGWIYARVKCAKASSTFYVDPLVTLT